MKRRLLLAAGLAVGVGAFIARRPEAAATLNLYSARHYNTDEALYGNFADASGIKINRIDAEPDPLLERLKAEGDKSPCDVFLTVDAGRIERARQMGRPLGSPRRFGLAASLSASRAAVTAATVRSLGGLMRVALCAYGVQ